MLQEDLKSIVVIRVEEEQFLDVNVDLVDNNLATLLASSLWAAIICASTLGPRKAQFLMKISADR